MAYLSASISGAICGLLGASIRDTICGLSGCQHLWCYLWHVTKVLDIAHEPHDPLHDPDACLIYGKALLLC